MFSAACYHVFYAIYNFLHLDQVLVHQNKTFSPHFLRSKKIWL